MGRGLRQIMSKVIAVINQKGGVGKTTTAINLAAYLSRLKKSVAVIDADPQGNTTSGLGLDKQSLNSTLYDVLIGRAQLDQTILPTKLGRLLILPANSHLAAVEVELVNQPGREQKLKALTDQLTQDYVLIDCPPALGLLTVNALTAADFVLIPVQAEYYALEGLSQLLEVIQAVRSQLNPKLEILGVLLTMYNSRTRLSEDVANEVKKFFGDKVLSTVIPRNVKLAEAPSHGKPISEFDRWSKGARAYKQLAKEIDNRTRYNR